LHYLKEFAKPRARTHFCSVEAAASAAIMTLLSKKKIMWRQCRGKDANGSGSSATKAKGSATTSNCTCLRIISQPTFPEDDRNSKKFIDTTNLNSKNLESLKQADPFLYFSIPVVRTAAIHNREIDFSTLHDSYPSRVERRSRISFECHTDLLMEELMDELSG